MMKDPWRFQNVPTRVGHHKEVAGRREDNEAIRVQNWWW